MLKQSLLCAALLLAALPALAEDKKDAPAPPMTEEQAIAALAPDSPWAQKELACRRLRQIGTELSVPVLAGLLNDEKLSHLARYALEPMPYPEVSAVLIKAAAEATGAAKAGAIISLGARKDAAATETLVAALKDENLDVVRAALGALGRIGDVPATEALQEYAPNAPEPVRPALGEALLAAADSYIENGNTTRALRLLEQLSDAQWPEHIRFGAFRNLVRNEPGRADERLLAVLGGDNAKLRDYAAYLVATLPKASSTGALAAYITKLPPAGQAALLNGLAGRKDHHARKATLVALTSGDTAVRTSAVRALGEYGDAEDAEKIAAQLGGDETVSTAAKNALTSMGAKGADDAIARAASGAQPAAKAVLLAVLADRMAPQTNSIAGAALGDENLDVRVAALGALAKLGAKDDIGAVLAALKKATDQGEQTAAANALNAIAGAQKDEVLPAIAAELKDAQAVTRATLLGGLVRIGSANALQTFLGELTDDKQDGRDDAVRLFTQWPTRDAAAPMLEMAKKDEGRRAELLRGYVRLATGEPDAGKKTEMLTAAWELAQRTEEKWIVLPGWGSLATPHSLEVLTKLLDDADVHNEAGIALITAAKSFAGQGEDQKKAAIEALKAVLAKSDNQGAKDRATKVLANLGVDVNAQPK